MLALDIHDEDHVRLRVHRPNTIQVLEEPGADHVGALAHDQRAVAIIGFHQLLAGEEYALRAGFHRSGTLALRHLRDGFDMRRCGTTASADDVEPAVVDEALQVTRDRLGRLVVLQLLVRKTSIGIAGDARGGKLMQRAQVIGHEFRTGPAIQTD